MNLKSFWKPFGILALIFVLLFATCHWLELSGVLAKLISVIMPIPIGLGIAFLLNLLLRLLEKAWQRLFGEKGRRAMRPICLILCLVIVAGLICLLMVAVVPQLVRTAGTLIGNIPSYVEKIKGWWASLSALLAKASIVLPPLELDSAQITDTVRRYLEEHGHLLLDFSIDFVQTFVSAIWDGALSIVLAIYILAQKERLCAAAKKLLCALFDTRGCARVVEVARLTSNIFSKFLTGQLTEALILGGLCFVGMLIFRMPYALLISVVIGVTALIPVFGAFIGIGVGAFLILMDSPIQALWFVVFILILQQLEGNLIYPRVVGKSVGLPGVWVIIAVTVGSSFGVVGMLVSVPLFSVVYTLLRRFAEDRERLRSDSEV